MASKFEELELQLELLGVKTEDLTILFTGPNEMILGEDDRKEKRAGMWEWLHPVIQIKNPRRLTRLQMVDRGSCTLVTDLRLSDFDFVSKGVIEFRHTGGFRLAWVDLESRIKYMESLVGFLENKKLESAQEAGIIIPSVVPNPMRK